MNFVPWRVKNFISDQFPLLYHLAVNLGASGNSAGHWDERLAETWHADYRSWPTKNELIASLTTKRDRILDIGCGNGSILRYLRGLGYADLHGLEISRYAIERLRGEGIEMHLGKLPLIPLPDASFDVVIASQVLEHVIRRKRFLREIQRVLKPSGRCLFIRSRQLPRTHERTGTCLQVQRAFLGYTDKPVFHRQGIKEHAGCEPSPCLSCLRTSLSLTHKVSC